MKRVSSKGSSRRKKPIVTPLEEIVVANVIRLRKERGWTQYDLAERLNRFQSWMNRLERGRSIPTLRTLADLAGAFEVDPIELLRK